MDGVILDRLPIDLSQCCGCGLCAGICPTNAISMKMEHGKYLPSFLKDRCTDCKICEKICKDSIADESVFHNEYNFHPYIGNFINCYTGFSTDNDIRKKSASGGLISSLLIYLLKSGSINGAVVTKLRYNGQTIETYPFIAKTEEDILDAKGSFYLPVNFSDVISEIKKRNNNDVFAIVALPCVISNLRKIQLNMPSLDKKIKYIFGLFCSYNFNYFILDYIKDKVKLRDGDVQNFNFRDGWPKSVISIRTSEKQYKLNSRYLNLLFNLRIYPMSEKCYVCSDCCAEFSDISFGDAWIPSIENSDNIGTSLFISRTKKGEELLNLANEKFINLSQITHDEVIYSQRSAMYFKKIQTLWLQEPKKNRFIPQLLITISITRSIKHLSDKYPSFVARIPYVIYKILFYIIMMSIVSRKRRI